jgi:hypothetical protein
MDLAHPGIITLNRASPEPGAAYSVLPEDTRGPDPHKPISVSISQYKYAEALPILFLRIDKPFYLWL